MEYQEADRNHEQTMQDLRTACEGNDAFRADLLDHLHLGEADLRRCLQEATPNIVLLRRLLEAGKNPWMFTHDTQSNKDGDASDYFDSEGEEIRYRYSDKEEKEERATFLKSISDARSYFQ